MRPAALLLALAGCGDGVHLRGTVDGQDVDLRGGYFVQDADAFPVEGDDAPADGLLLVVLSTLDAPCDDSILVEEGLSTAQSPADAADAWASVLPPEFWEIVVALRVEDPGDDLEGLTLDSMRLGDDLAESGDVSGTLTHYQRHLDEALWSGTAPIGEYLETWATDGGSLEVTRHDPGTRIAGRLDTEAITLTFEEVGDLILRFDVDRCEGMERWFFGG